MKAIVTKYHGPTNTQGTRISASVEGHRVTVARDYSLNADENHAAAAMALKHKLEWRGKMVGGTLPNGDMAWVFKSDIEIE